MRVAKRGTVGSFLLLQYSSDVLYPRNFQVSQHGLSVESSPLLYRRLYL